ncbi:MAG: magnesium chelatase, partial [Clostridia bacterium]
VIKERINKVRNIQRERFKSDGILTNAEMGSREVAKYCAIDDRCERLLQKAFEKLNLSARGTTRILKVARTIADIEGSQSIEAKHIAEAIQYRGLDKKYN